MRYSLSYKILLSLSLLAACPNSYAQKLSPVQSFPQARFIITAPVLVPQLVQERKWEQLDNFLENWRRSGASSDELIFSISVLSAIENKMFTVAQLPCDGFRFLDDYAWESKMAEESPASFSYSIRLPGRHWYDASGDARKLLLFIQAWARRLMVSWAAGSTELFICQVMAGEIRYPTSDLIRNKGSYTELNNFRLNLESYYDRSYSIRREGRLFTVGLTAGIWSPTRNLQTLGTHPSIGMFFGGRHKMNEYDIVMAFRFLHPTPRGYTFVRGDTAYNTHYYDGGYIGLDYTRYIFHTGRLELGLTSAAGYDWFDVIDGFKDDYSIAHLEPFNEGSFDFSNGFRVKYYSRRGTFVGLAAKYHLIHYSNEGGTDLSGNAFTIDLVWGIH